METLFRWSKYVTDEQLDDWETKLVMAEVAYTAEKLVNRKRWQLNSYATTREAAVELQGRFGGGISELKPDHWQPSGEPDAGVLLRIRDQIIVTESKDEAILAELRAENPERTILSFPPQLAFGTGAHPTTAGCLRFLADFAGKQGDRPWRVLDLGCGSAILAVAAAKLGATEIVAVENDDMALDYARINAVAHDCSDRIEFIEADVLELIHDEALGRFDLIAANLFSDLLVQLFPSFPARLADAGEVIVSGCLTSQVKAVTGTAAASGIILKDFLRRGKWVAARSVR
ncbi:50S ribosomal protein L11 methyltransferase [Verrucomicrobiales bacterium BCK34]|nr:50S ribosomal protein L11 methyltransferase [Verrucomicrobiales bacterium BCK34]